MNICPSNSTTCSQWILANTNHRKEGLQGSVHFFFTFSSWVLNMLLFSKKKWSNFSLVRFLASSSVKSVSSSQVERSISNLHYCCVSSNAVPNLGSKALWQRGGRQHRFLRSIDSLGCWLCITCPTIYTTAFPIVSLPSLSAHFPCRLFSRNYMTLKTIQSEV